MHAKKKKQPHSPSAAADTHGEEKEPRPEKGRETEDEKQRRKRYRDIWERLKKEHGRKFTAWLLIRYRDDDLGFRPIPSGEKHWKSPDIWIESSDPLGRGVAGEENFVHARLFNLGKATAAPVRVDFFWANPAMGLGPANMNLIGTEWVEVEAHHSLDVRCNTAWVPVFVNDGHECLMVNSSCPILDPIQHPFQPKLDRHVGQRNVTVVEAAAGDMVEFSLAVNNVFSFPIRALIGVCVDHFAVDAEAARKLRFNELVNRMLDFEAFGIDRAEELRTRFLPGTLEFRQAQQAAQFVAARRSQKALPPVVQALGGTAAQLRAAACVSAEWTDHSCILAPTGGTGAAARLFVAEDLLSARARALPADLVTLQETDLKAFQQRTLTLQLGVPGGARRGEFLVYHVSQRTENLLLGGYSIVVRVRGARAK